MRRILIVPVIAGMLLTLAACGAKEETATTADNNPSAKSSDSDQSTTTEKKTTTTEGDSTDEEDPTSDPSMPDLGDIPGLSEECAAITTVYTGVMAQAGVLLNPASSDKAELEKLLDQMEDAKADIPDEIADAFDTWSEAWAEFATTMNGMTPGGMADPANLEKLEAASEKLDSPEVEAANEQIDEYIQKSCS